MKQSVQIVGRITAGAVLLGAVGVAAWWDHSADAEPLLTGAEGPVSQHVEIADARTLLACPGQPVLASLGEDAPTQDADGEDEPPVGTYDPEYAPDAGNATSLINAISIGTAQSAPATTILDSLSLREEQPETETVELGGSGAAHNGRITSEGPVSFIATARPDSDQNPLVTGVRFGSATEGDLRGIAATPCIPIAAEQWLIGGQTEAGSSAKLELMNPSDTAASVRLDLWGAAGPIDPVGSSSVLVPPGEHRSILLEGLAPAERRVAVRVQSSGARVGAVIQDVRTLGLRPAGVDYVAPAAPLDTVAAIPGLEIQDGDAAFLRLLVPGDEPGSVDIKLVGPTGDIGIEDLLAQEVAGDSVTDISLAGIPSGTYTAIIESDVPLTASAFLASGEEDSERDIAWMPAVARDTTNVFALPEAEVEVARTLVVAGVEEEAVAQISFLTDGGEIVETDQLFVAAGEARNIRVPEQAGEENVEEDVVGVLVESDEPVAAGLVLRSEVIQPGGVALLPGMARSILPSGIDVQYRP